MLLKAAALLEARAEAVARDLTLEEGKTIGEARGETMRGVAILRYFAGQTSEPCGETYPSANPATFLYTTRVPLGVVGLITPWNFPIAIPVWKAAPGPGLRQHGGDEAGRADAAAPRSMSRSACTRRGCPPACSTWCMARAEPWAIRWWPTRG